MSTTKTVIASGESDAQNNNYLNKELIEAQLEAEEEAEAQTIGYTYDDDDANEDG